MQLSHALSIWAEHVEVALGASVAETLEQRDLYARIALQKLPAQQRSDLLEWAEAHSVLAFLLKDGLFERFVQQAPRSYAALCKLGTAAATAGCADESPYALLSDTARMRTIVSDAAPVAGKLARMLPWVANPLAAVSGVGQGGTRLRTAGHQQMADEGEYVRVVRVRHNGGEWSRTLDWDEMAIVREPSPGRDKLGNPFAQRFGRASLRDV